METTPYLVGWDTGAQLLKTEAEQLKQEGRDPHWIDAYLKTPDESRTEAETWAGLQAAPQRADFAFREPSDLDEIRAQRTDGWRKRALTYSSDVLQDRMLGAWLGRCCGCALGKPVEVFMSPENRLSSKDRIKTYLQGISSSEYPLNNYFPLTSPAHEKSGTIWCPASCRENIGHMESDDDIRYTVIGQKVLLEKGRDFTTLDLMKAWITLLPYEKVCTAETQAYRNYVQRFHVRAGKEPTVDWTWVATHQNPYREWIGAQIRADSFGYAAPGNPELAAEFAWRDARMSHVKNGIYGEMFVAAMIAAAFVLDDPLAIVEAGLAEIPKASRLHAEMQQTIEVCRRHKFKADAFEAVFDDIYKLFNYYNPVHTNNNAALVVAALLLGKSDYDKAITIAVMGGWDSDCNGATVGSIVGAMIGAENIPLKWKAPLHDTLYSEIYGYHPIAISECARRSVEIARKIDSALC